MANQHDREWQFTTAAHDPHDSRHHGSINIPLYQTSLFSFETYQQFEEAMQDAQENHVYSRGNNPTVCYLEKKLAQLEGAEEAKCFASGMAAISTAILSAIQAGDHVVCVDQAYGPTKELLHHYLAKFNIETTFVDGSSLDNICGAIRPNTKLLYLESPSTRMMQLQDLKSCAELARNAGILTIIDNTWATPCYQQPLALGIDLVVHSITKYISGQSDSVGGVVLGSKQLVRAIGNNEYMLFGGIMTAYTAAQVTRGLRTLPLRMERHRLSGLAVAEHMSRQPYVTRVNHPGLLSHPQHALALRQMSGTSGLFSFESTESVEKMKEWANRLQFFKIGVSWGGFESLVTVGGAVEPACGEGARSLVRLHVGLESPQDLICDLDQAWLSISESTEF